MTACLSNCKLDEPEGRLIPSGGRLSEGPPTEYPSLHAAFHSNFEIVLARTPDVIAEALALRYQVYCLERGFEDASVNTGGFERDRYDSRAVHAIVRARSSGDCIGAVRLVLADPLDRRNPFPLETRCADTIFADAAAQIGTLPRSSVAEISRFAVSKTFRRRFDEAKYEHGMSPNVNYSDAVFGDSSCRRLLPMVTIGLFAAVIQLSAAHRIEHWYALMEPTLLRLLRGFGIRFPTIGPLVEHHGRRYPTFAQAADLIEIGRLARPDVWALVTDNGRNLAPSLVRNAANDSGLTKIG